MSKNDPYGALFESHKKMTENLRRGQVWCKTCLSFKMVDPAHCLQHGWPKCCGETMTIDSPEEWSREAKRVDLQKRRVAEWRGWRVTEKRPAQGLPYYMWVDDTGYIPEGYLPAFDMLNMAYEVLPDWPNSLDAMHELEMWLRDSHGLKVFTDYTNMLVDASLRSPQHADGGREYAPCCAPARVRWFCFLEVHRLHLEAVKGVEEDE